jgi:hypothetical protein
MNNLPEPVARSDMRICDQDRENAVAVVHKATGDGRLDLNEADTRLRAIYAAKTYGELTAINADLPASTGSLGFGRATETPRARTAIAIMGGFSRKGAWIVPRRLTTIAFWGGGELDFRKAVFGPEPVTVRVFAVMGGVEIVLPENAAAQVTGIGIMGAFDQEGDARCPLDGPRVVVSGFAFWGGVNVRTAPIDEASG